MPSLMSQIGTFLRSKIGAANGFAGLGGDGKLSDALLSDNVVLADQTNAFSGVQIIEGTPGLGALFVIRNTSAAVGEKNWGFRIYGSPKTIAFGTVSDANVFENVAFAVTRSGGDITEFLVAGEVINFSGLPTTDPGIAGRGWLDGTTLKVSAG